MTATPAHANRLLPGQPWPLGAQVIAEGVNLAVWAPDATAVEWCVFDDEGRAEIGRFRLPACTDGVWHGLLPQAGAGWVYGLRVHGPWAPAQGHRFNPHKVLLDPYAREVVGGYAGDLSLYRGDDGHGQPCQRDNAAVALKARVCATPPAAARPPSPGHAWADTVLYELHVKGATMRHPEVPAALRGSYAGLAHPAFIAHLQTLGITTLSLLPVHARADEERLQAMGLSNYWGYSPIGWFAPEPRYWSGAPGTTPSSEFRAMVDALHAAGIEVILDVVYNHSAETDELGPTLSLRGLANARYYRLDAHDPSRYINWAGCGNVLDFTEPRVVQCAIESLRHWVQDLGVDGFRFDLAPILARGPDGAFTRAAGFLAAMQADPVLARVKWVAEPWDIGPHGYQLGAFPAGWQEWNDRWRDGLRRFWLQPPPHSIGRGELAHRLAGSSQEFRHDARAPTASINFLCAHDGFTLRDLLSYEHKHNLANGEHNRDGHSHNLGWHCGVEGPTEDPYILALRQGLARALLGTLLLSQGTPMLLAGDEIGHTQQGNNNAYCQDNALTWLDWSTADADLLATTARLIRLRREVLAQRLAHWWAGDDHVRWLDAAACPLGAETWQRNAQGDAQCLQVLLPGAAGDGASDALIVFNAAAEGLPLTLPPGAWRPLFCSTEAGGVPPDGLLSGQMPWPARSLRLCVRVPELAERA